MCLAGRAILLYRAHKRRIALCPAYRLPGERQEAAFTSSYHDLPSLCCCSMNAWNAASNVSNATLKAGNPVISGDEFKRWLRCAARNESASSVSYKATWQGSGRQRCENSGSFIHVLHLWIPLSSDMGRNKWLPTGSTSTFSCYNENG